VYDLGENKDCEFVITSAGQMKKTDLASIFVEADRNNNGLISVAELKAYFKKKKVLIWSAEEFRNLWRDADSDLNSQIDFLEFKRVMTAASTGHTAHPKWRELLENVKAENGTSTEIRLYREDGSWGKRLIAITHSKAAGTGGRFRKSLFSPGFRYCITLNETDTPNNMELARTQVFHCTDSNAALKARLERERIKRLAALKAKTEHDMRVKKIALAKAKRERERRDRERAIEKALRIMEAEERRRIIKAREERDKKERELKDRVKRRMALKRVVPRNAAVVIDDVFDKIDKNRNGKISLSELKKYINELGAPLTTADVQKMFREADLDHNAQINKSEFRQVMKNAKNCSSTSEWNALYKLHVDKIAAPRSKKRRIARVGTPRFAPLF
jgi:Ca2+-binding EF-hand superfamily protein